MTERVLQACACTALTALLAVPSVSAVGQSGLNKSIFLTLLDESGKPLTSLTADQVAIREDGVDRSVVAVKPASQPLSVAILVDTAQGRRETDAYGSPDEYIRDMRTAATTLAKRLLQQSPDASISLMEFGQAAVTVVPYTQSLEQFNKGVNTLMSRPNVGTVLMEGLERANDDLSKRPSPRRAIVAFNFEPADEQSREDPNKVKKSFAESGAQFWSVSVQRGSLKNAKRDTVLNDFAKYSGGQREFIVGISALETLLSAYADALAAQFEVVYQRPENAKNVKVVQVGTTLQGLKMHASGFAPK